MVKFLNNRSAIIPDTTGRPIRIRLRDFVKNELEVSLGQTHQIKNSHALDPILKQYFRRPPYPDINPSRIAFPHKDGYLQFFDKAVYDMRADFYNILVDEGIADTRILCQNGWSKPYYGDSLPLSSLAMNDDFSEDDYVAMRHFIGFILRWSYDHTTWDDGRFPLTKTTTPSGLSRLPNGKIWKSKDYRVGIMTKASQLYEARYCSNYLPLKREMIEVILSDTHHDLNQQYREKSYVEIAEDFPFWLEQGLGAISITGVRGNQVKKPINLDPSERYDGRILYSSPRHINYSDDGKIFEADINVEKYMNTYAKFMPKPFVYTDLRMICNASGITNYQLLPFTRRAIAYYEKGKYGFLSLREDVIKRRMRYCSQTNHLHNSIFLRMDTTNSDKFINSNSDKLWKIIPDPVSYYLKKTTLTLQVLPYGHYLVNGVNSGTAFTTLGNVLMGFRRSFTVLRDYLGCKISDITQAYERMITNDDDFYKVVVHGSEYFCYHPLGTDDQCIEIRSNDTLDTKDLKEYASLKLEQQKKWDGAFFGMSLTRDGCEVDVRSFIAKTLFVERPGFYYNDLFGLQCRIKQLSDAFGPALAKSVYKIVEKYSGITESELKASPNIFFAVLNDMGISKNEVYNKYSPKEEILYGNALKVLQKVSIHDDFFGSDRLTGEVKVTQRVVEKIAHEWGYDDLFKSINL